MENVKKFWEERSKKYLTQPEGVLFKSFPKEINSYIHQWMLSQIISKILPSKSLKVLDVGCGYGRLAQPLLKRFPKVVVYGIDVAPTSIKLFNKNLRPRGRAKVADVRKVPFKNEYFDVVFMVTTLMYLPSKNDQKKAIKELFRVLKQNGKFIFIEREPIGYGIFTLGGITSLLRGKKNREIKATSFRKEYMKELITGETGVIQVQSGIPVFTFMIYPLLFLSFLNKGFLINTLNLIKRFDETLNKLLTFSLYIAYIGIKQNKNN